MAQRKEWHKSGNYTVSGKKVGVVMSNSSGQKKVLLNPHGKYVKYTTELRNHAHLTNTGEVKKKDGKVCRLTTEEQAFRAGYRSAVIDQAKAFNAKR